LIKLQNTDDKNNTLKNAKFLNNTNISTSEWLTKEEIEKKSHLLKEKRFAIDEGKNAWLKGRTLLVEDPTTKIQKTCGQENLLLNYWLQRH